MKTSYCTEADAAKHLLLDASELLNRHGVNFVVVGGWAAYLFHSSRYGHPGTFDVDVLLDSISLEDGTFERASEDFLQNAYLRAPKNTFQAHRILNVSGEDLVYHVDFLNERHPAGELNFVGGSGKLRSIYTPAMQAVFSYGNFRTLNDCPGIRFPSPETFVVTKAAAARVKKRPRDAFDIFVTVADQSETEFSSRWATLVAKDGIFQAANEELRLAIDEGDAISKILAVFEENKTSLGPVPSEAKIRTTFGFLVSER
jgi:hypothetical protein